MISSCTKRLARSFGGLFWGFRANSLRPPLHFSSRLFWFCRKSSRRRSSFLGSSCFRVSFFTSSRSGSSFFISSLFTSSFFTSPFFFSSRRANFCTPPLESPTFSTPGRTTRILGFFSLFSTGAAASGAAGSTTGSDWAATKACWSNIL